MGFLDEYKKLDNLCKDLFGNDTGISAYLAELEKCDYRRYQINNWETDYQMLRNCRHKRNQVVHENWATEDSLCSERDTIWVKTFYNRILNREDPLAEYQKIITRPTIQQNISKVPTITPVLPKQEQASHILENLERIEKESKHSSYFGVWILAAITFVVVAITIIGAICVL